MTDKDYTVRGCTALLDAIGDAIHHIGNIHKYARPEDVPEHTLFIITTDGMENASRFYSSDRVKQMIPEHLWRTEPDPSSSGLLSRSENEKRLIENKMQQIGTENFGAYARKMLIDGYIIKVDYTQQKRLAAAVSRAASNINQICRRINSTGHFYEDDVAELKERQKEIWQLLKSSQSEEL